MSSILKVDTIQDSSGNNIINESSNTITIGASGDTTNIVGTVQNDGASLANTPAFHAYNPQNGSVANNTNIIVSNNTELFDSGSAYNTSDYKFTPQTAGYYFLYGQVRYESGDNDFDRINLEILKNGSAILASRNNNTDYSTVNVAGTVVANGSSDYFQLQSYHGRGSSVNITTADEYTFFGGFLIKTS